MSQAQHTWQPIEYCTHIGPCDCMAPLRPARALTSRFHPATWTHSLPAGELSLSIPLPISSEDADDIEQLFVLILRTVRRSLLSESAVPVAQKEGRDK